MLKFKSDVLYIFVAANILFFWVTYGFNSIHKSLNTINDQLICVKHSIIQLNKLISNSNRLDKSTNPANKNYKKINLKEEVRLANIIKLIQPKLKDGQQLLIAKAIIKISKKYNIDPLLVSALIYEESTFRPFVQSKSGAVGLMQIKYSVWKEHKILKDSDVKTKNDLFYIENNINCGVRILRKYIDEANGNIVIALNRYHSGVGKLNCKEYEVDYVNRVMLKYYELQQQWRLNSHETN